ncbi:MAG: M48 family metallopeptidase [Rhodospirillales bacterium]|nr:M48 family metallopeptidase [Rhodospirillales bacterium]
MIGLLRKNRSRARPVPEPGSVEVDGQVIPVRFRVNKRARGLILRVETHAGGGGEAVVTLPPGVDRDTALEFAEERAFWIMERLIKAPPSVCFDDGAVIPFLGADHMIRHQPGQRTPVIRDGGVLLVGGQPEHLPRRLKEWLKKEARRKIELQVIELTAKIEKRHSRISIRDTRSRWGSCSSSGALNFSWRLVMAPEWVLDYVVAHEVAHLAEHNHSPDFWAVVAHLNDDAIPARDWLAKYGEALHHYG